MKTHLTTAALLVAALSSFAQQDMMYSQYMNNQLAINPAFAGTGEFPSATFLHRKQWLDFEGAPTTQAFSLHSPILRKNVGLGLMVENDKTGVTNRLNISGCYSYHLNLGYGNKLSAGILGGMSYYSTAFSDPKFRVWDTEDPVFAADKKTSVPNFGFGLYYRYAEKFYAGISVPRLIDYRTEPFKNDYFKEIPREQRHYYFTSGYSMNAGDHIKIKPSVLIKYVQAAPVQADINVSVLFSDAFLAGASYRTGDAVIAMIGFQMNKKLRVGYSFDMTVSGMRNYSSNTHEILVGYDFYREYIKMKTPRFF